MKTKVISKSVNDLVPFIDELSDETNTNQNLILDLSTTKKVNQKEVKLFLPLAKIFKKNKCSFVLVLPDIDFNKVSDKITVVPSLQEAHDIIEMEKIERDLE